MTLARRLRTVEQARHTFSTTPEVAAKSHRGPGLADHLAAHCEALRTMMKERVRRVRAAATARACQWRGRLWHCISGLVVWASLGCAEFSGTAAPASRPAPAQVPSLLAQVPPAPANWLSLHRGLRYTTTSPWPDSRVHVLQLQLDEPTLRLRLSEPQHRGLPMQAQLQALLPTLSAATAGWLSPQAAVVAALNASFFDRRFVPRGHTVSEGQTWSETLVPLQSPLLACDRLQRCALHFEPTPRAPEHWFTAVAGTPWLVREGAARQSGDDRSCVALCAQPHPRTALGLDESGRVLTVVLVEGRRGAVLGVALAPLAQWLVNLGVHSAVNLDGGGSSTLWLQGQAVMTRPANEAAERPLANALFIVRVAVDGQASGGP